MYDLTMERYAMKKRLIISAILILILSISFSLVFPLMDLDVSIIYTVFATIGLVLLILYLFNGIAKFLVVLSYSILIIVSLILWPDYQQPIIVIGSLLIILNPLANFEAWLEKKLLDEDILPLRISIRGKYWPFYSYRQEMKNYIRLPQTKKLFTNLFYLRTRQLVTIILLFAAIYLFINELKNIYIDLQNYNLYQIFTFYGVITLFVLTFILYKNGFTAMFKAAIMFIFIPVIYATWLLPISEVSKIIMTSIFFILGIADIIYEKISSLHRVAYHAYKYYDPADLRYVYANEFYEPLVYNETYNIVGIYTFASHVNDFHKVLNDILFYSNRKHFMITAYTFNGKEIVIYTEFFHKHVKRAQRFITYLETIFKTKVKEQIVYDRSKQIYEQTFFHKTEYIVSRALSLANLLDELDIQNKDIIISIIFSFRNLDDILAFSNHYYVARMEELDDTEYYAAKVSVKTTNSKFSIEQKVRDILLSALIYRANYVRILVYYEGESKK